MRFLLFLLMLLPLPGLAAEPDLLPPEKAFQFSARLSAPDAVEVRYQIAPGYYMYRDKFSFAVAPPPARLGAAQLPPGKMKRDEFFGDVETYRGELIIRIPLETGGAAAGGLTLTAISQGCADVGVCYVPQEQQAQLRLASFAPGAAPSTGGGLAQLFAQGSGGAGSQDTEIAALFAGEFWLLTASFFVFGLLLSFTPCVLPMVPILSGIIAGRGHRLTKMRGFLLSGAYVLGMAITYALAGVAAGLSGAMLSAALQNPWVLGAFAAVFVALALAMFGAYELQLPVALQSRLAVASNQLHGGHFAGVFSMGILSALIMGPCVAAPLAGALLYISQSRDVVLGGTALFAMGVGMGVPLLAVGASAGALVPKAGRWMDSVNRFFGVLLLGVAIYLVSPIIPVAVELLAWAALLIVTGVFLRAFDALPQAAHGFQRFSKGVGILLVAAGVAFLIGALSGGRDVLQPLSGLRAGIAGAAPGTGNPVVFQRISSTDELDRAISAAAGKPVMLDFYADWCVTCKEMERYTFSDAKVQARLAQMVKVQADVTANSAEHAALLRRFRLFGPPGIIFFDRGGREIEGLRAIGFQPADKFVLMLDQVLAVQ